ncbi:MULTISPECIES: hypothetical protein [Streptosporangium]|uniref:Uncharacterized protein n=1 Tax=Streptosporangium brasiliense TaxID=47480 RepID=A0ABT9RME6_9ACTN|nr:hypothetical protein [Streptosporangium brasiliense]MDP9869884.1 hypothetical protein [Streptosporangium brasiliense]
MFLRIAITAQTVALLLQAVTAGLLLASPGGRTAHSAAAVGVVVTVLLNLGAALVSRRSSAILSAAGMLVMTLAQMALGIAHMKSLHVPLGVLMFGVSMVQLARVWSVSRTKTASA